MCSLAREQQQPHAHCRPKVLVSTGRSPRCTDVAVCTEAPGAAWHGWRGQCCGFPLALGDTEAPQCLHCLSRQRHALAAGYTSPRGIQDLLLADPELINSTKAAWLGSSPDCRRSRLEQERCGARQWWQMSARGSGQGGSRKVQRRVWRQRGDSGGV